MGSQSRPSRSELVTEFAAIAACIASESAPGPRLRGFRRRLLQLARGPGREAVPACALLLCTEALACGGNARDAAVVAAAVEIRRQLLAELGRERWDELRATGGELVRALLGRGAASPRRLSVLHRVLSLVSGLKHGAPLEELALLSRATAAALRLEDAEGCCGICLASWGEDGDHRVLVPRCGHALHADCFWRLVLAPCAQAYRGRCRTCRQPLLWGPLARSNLRCTLAAALASGVATAAPRMAAEELAEFCLRIAEDVGGKRGARRALRTNMTCWRVSRRARSHLYQQ